MTAGGLPVPGAGRWSAVTGSGLVRPPRQAGLLRRGTGIRAPSTLGSFLRGFTWRNVLQQGAPAVYGGVAAPRPSAARRGRARVHRRHRLAAEAGLLACLGGRRVWDT